MEIEGSNLTNIPPLQLPAIEKFIEIEIRKNSSSVYISFVSQNSF